MKRNRLYKKDTTMNKIMLSLIDSTDAVETLANQHTKSIIFRAINNVVYVMGVVYSEKAGGKICQL